MPNSTDINPTRRQSLSVRLAVRRRLDRMLGHTKKQGLLVDEATFMMLFDLEFERSRRNQRVFSLSRFEVAQDADRSSTLTDQAVAQIRSCDAATFVDHHLIVLWSESLPGEVASAIERILDSGDGSLTWKKSVAFPENALTRSAMLSEILSPSASIPQQVYSKDVRSDEATENLHREAQ
jgi:hypothetical protein